MISCTFFQKYYFFRPVFIKRYIIIRRISIILLSIFLLSSSAAFAQQKKLITGIVVSTENNEALPGVTIKIKGTQSGTITDDEGRYSLRANKQDTLIFGFIGF